MAKPKNAIPTHKLTIATTPQVIEVLDWLVQQGFHGKSRSEVAEELLRRTLLKEHVEPNRFGPDVSPTQKPAGSKPR
ncbi:MAG: hypothetical protein MK179_02600 [Pirellulaceae bacterium]|mgnify:CR=1|nr:hypothetical protein [Pirellulaceae bacterium]